MAVIPAASAMDAAGNMGGIRPDGIYFIRDGELKFYPWDQLGGGGGTAGNGLPAGGNIGDVLVKTGAADYAAGWSPQAGLEIHSYEMTRSGSMLTVDIPADVFNAGKMFLIDGVSGDYHILSTIMTADGLEAGNYFVTSAGIRFEYTGAITDNGDSVSVVFTLQGRKDWVSGSTSGGTIFFPSDLTAIMHVLSAATATQGERGPDGERGPAGQGVPAGGTKGQVLAKTGPADYETAWEDAPAGESYEWVKVADIPVTQLTFDVTQYYSRARATIDVDRYPTNDDVECYLALKSGGNYAGNGYNPFSGKELNCLAILGSNANILSVEVDYFGDHALGRTPQLVFSFLGAGNTAPSYVSQGIITGEFWVKVKHTNET